MKTRLGGFGAASLLFTLLVSCTCSGQRTLVVPDDYPSIQEAIDVAEPGDTVYVAGGRYVENLVIDKSLSLVGEDRTTTIIHSLTPEEDVITLALVQARVDIAHMKIAGGYRGIDMEADADTYVDLRDIILYGNHFGVSAFGRGALTIEASYFVDTDSIGILLGNAGARVTSTEIIFGETGILLVGPVKATLSDNFVCYCDWGIDTYTLDCGWLDGEQEFSGVVYGGGNKVTRVSGTCPSYPAVLWPEGFVQVSWGEAVRAAGEADNRGLDLFGFQDYEGAIGEYESGLTLLEEEPFPLLQAYLEHDLGNAYIALGFYGQALKGYQSALKVYAARGMEYEMRSVSPSLVAVGDHYASIREYETAVDIYLMALPFYQSLMTLADVAKLHVKIGAVLEELGLYTEALASDSAALALYVESGMELEAAVMQNSMGNLYTKLARYGDALASYGAALATFSAYGMERERIEVSENVGIVYWYLGRYEEAFASYATALAFYTAHGMEVNVAGVSVNMGIIYRNLGCHEEALASHGIALSIYEANQLESETAKTYVNIGVVYDELGQYDDALHAYESARHVYTEREMDVSVANVDVNIGIVYAEQHRYGDALGRMETARVVYSERGLETSLAYVEANIGRIYMLLESYEDALDNFERALGVLDETTPLPGASNSFISTRWVILENEGICHEMTGEWNQARDAYMASVDVIESIRTGLTSEAVKNAWYVRTRDVYERLVDLLCDMNQGSSAFSYVERCRARIFLDTLYSGGVSPDQLISPEAGVSSGAVDVVAIDTSIITAQDMLLPSEAVLEYMVTDSGVYLWVITSTNGTSNPIYVEYPRQELMREVIVLRQELESLDPDSSSIHTSLGSLYEQLVRPGLDLLSDDVDTLILVPSGPLWYVPFSSLTMTDYPEVEPEGGVGPFKQYRPPYLLETYTLAFLPSLASLPAFMDNETAVPGGSLLVLANPALTTEQVQDLDLINTVYFDALEEAARAFALCYVGSDECVHTQSNAEEPRAYGQTGPVGVEVYACHGSFNSYVPLQSKLLLGPGNEEESASEDDPRNPDGNYHAWEAMLTDHHGAELVVLAACETLLPAIRNLSDQQLERIVVGDEVVGLARAFLSSGAQAVLGTLWQANPRAIEQLLVAMCGYYQQGMTWARALQQAQQTLIVNPTFGNPWLWAPYQLIGRWR